MGDALKTVSAPQQLKGTPRHRHHLTQQTQDGLRMQQGSGMLQASGAGGAQIREPLLVQRLPLQLRHRRVRALQDLVELRLQQAYMVEIVDRELMATMMCLHMMSFRRILTIHAICNVDVAAKAISSDTNSGAFHSEQKTHLLPDVV